METINKAIYQKSDNVSIRKCSLYDSLSLCDNDNVRIELLVDMVVKLQENLLKLQREYIDLVSYIKNNSGKSCAHLPF